MDDVLVIDVNYREVLCSLCGAETARRRGVPVFNGDLVSNAFPDWLWHAGGGSVPVCRQCYHAHAAGRYPVHDDAYRHPAEPSFLDGEGI